MFHNLRNAGRRQGDNIQFPSYTRGITEPARFPLLRPPTQRYRSTQVGSQVAVYALKSKESPSNPSHLQQKRSLSGLTRALRNFHPSQLFVRNSNFRGPTYHKVIGAEKKVVRSDQVLFPRISGRQPERTHLVSWFCRDSL